MERCETADAIVAMLNRFVREEDEKAANNHKLRGWHTIRASAAHEIVNMILRGEHQPKETTHD